MALARPPVGAAGRIRAVRPRSCPGTNLRTITRVAAKNNKYLSASWTAVRRRPRRPDQRNCDGRGGGYVEHRCEYGGQAYYARGYYHHGGYYRGYCSGYYYNGAYLYGYRPAYFYPDMKITFKNGKLVDVQ